MPNETDDHFSPTCNLEYLEEFSSLLPAPQSISSSCAPGRRWLVIFYSELEWKLTNLLLPDRLKRRPCDSIFPLVDSCARKLSGNSVAPFLFTFAESPPASPHKKTYVTRYRRGYCFQPEVVSTIKRKRPSCGRQGGGKREELEESWERFCEDSVVYVAAKQLEIMGFTE